MSKMLAFAKQHPFILTLSAIALLVGIVSISSSFWSTSNAASLGKPINLDPVVSLDQVGEDQFDMRIAEMQLEHKLGIEENPQARAEWFWKQRAYPAQQISTESFRNAISAEAERRTPQDATATTWELAGPMPLKAQTMGTGAVTTDVSGRALAVAIQPGNSNNILVGAAQGGIWQSTDGGTTFQAVADNMPSLAIKVIRFAASDTNIVYAGSGEPHGGDAIYGMGVFKSTDGGATWNALPSNGQGWDFRNVSVSGLQVDSTNPNTLYVTTADVSASLYFTSIPAHPQTGIFKSTDGGQTWTRKQDSVRYSGGDQLDAGGVGFMDLDLFQANSNVLFATELFGGIYRSTDAGETWQLITPAKNLTQGQAPHSTMGANFPAAVPQYSKYDENENKFTTSNTVARSNETPEFHRIEISLAQSGGSIQANDPSTYVLYAGYGTKVQLEGDVTDAAGLIFKSTDGGTTWQWLGDWGNQGVPNYCRDQCTYDNMVEVNPTDPNDVIVGGNGNVNYTFPDPAVNPTRYIYNKPWSGVVQRSLDGGNTWIDTTPICASYTARTEEPTTLNGLPVVDCQLTQEDSSKNIIHVDAQGAAYDWANKHLYVVNDGGLNRATVSGDGTNSLSDYTWETLNDHLSTLQFYDVGTHPTDANKIFGAMQDNGTGLWNGTFWDAWPGGDGTVSQFDPKEPQYVYWGDTNSLSRHDNGGSRDSDSGWTQLFKGTIGDNDRTPFVTILEIDPVESNIIYVASETGIYRSTERGNQGTWQKVFTISEADLENYVHPTTISVSPKDNNVVWVGTSNGQVHMLDIASQQAFNITDSEFPNRYVSKIEASPNDANMVYVTFNGYDANSTGANGNGKAGKVFKGTKNGTAVAWTNISGNMTQANNLDVPVLALAIDSSNENHMWIGTDTGTRLTTDGGASWVSYRHNMPPVSVVALEYNANTQYLTAGTHGRGIWRVQPGTNPTAITMGSLDATNGTGQTLLLSLITATMGIAAGALFLVRRRRKA